ncbi:hypothetical protein KUTeg_008403 [Tegillarca granosa]|uniref:Uncharacterized protein n=1 Tax=Tegillarca granosa TaxID=220873 RepID=A0ABQ9FDA6_TEGGR|nr:hypothetical protein KUTeg_008403 [Tegillarca granosa]
MSKEELDVVIKIQLFHHRHNDVNTNKKKHKEKERERPRQEYYFGGKLEYQQHLENCKIQRDEYRQLCDDAKAMYSQMPDDKKQGGNQHVLQVQYSFDYAQQVHFPHYAQQIWLMACNHSTT